MALPPTDIRILLLQRGVSQADIARGLDPTVTRQRVNEVIRQKSSAPRIRRAIATALRLSYLAVWGEEDPGIDLGRAGRPPRVIPSHVNANPPTGRAA